MSSVLPLRRHRKPAGLLFGALGIILVIFAVLGLLEPNAPGLYMDAINPDYEVVKVLHPEAPVTVWEAPGALMFGRFPLLFELYAGDLVTYWMVPFSVLFGDSILSVRIARVVFGMLLLCAVALLCRELTRSNVIAVAATLALAVDPTFVYGLRTQAYVVLFPLIFVIAALFIAHRYPNARTYFFAGALVGLAAYGYFVYLFVIPGVALFALRDSELSKRINALASLAVGICIGMLPYVLAYGLLFGSLGISGGLSWIHGALAGLRVSSDNSYMANVTAIFTTIGLVLSDAWVRLTIWQNAPFDFWQALKVWIVVGIPFLAFLALYAAHAVAKRAFAVIAFAIASFIICATYFGPRLGGHDLTSVLTLGYVAAAVGTAALMSSATSYHRAAAIALAACATVVFVANVTATVGFASKLARNGGGSLYSMVISNIPKDALASGDTKTPYIFVTWGEMMPFIYETAGTIPAFAGDQLAGAVCHYGSANVVLLADEASFPSAQTPFPPAGLVTTSDHLLHDATSGLPYRLVNLKSSRPAADCMAAGNAPSHSAAAAPEGPAKAELRLTTTSQVTGVLFEAQPNPVPLPAGATLPVVSLRWNAPGASKIEIHVGTPGGRVFTAGGNAGIATTGPWVQAGDHFFLQDVSAGSPGKTIATMSVSP